MRRGLTLNILPDCTFFLSMCFVRDKARTPFIPVFAQIFQQKSPLYSIITFFAFIAIPTGGCPRFHPRRPREETEIKDIK